MTRRIVLTLADDTTETRCGDCEHRRHTYHATSVTTVCGVFGRDVGLRLPECLAAEAAASRLVEIAPDDADTLATIVDDWNRRCIPDADLPESIARIRDVLRDHAGPDR